MKPKSDRELMLYILALILPPLAILLAGRPILGIVIFFIWIPALVFSGGLTHPMFILLAWLIIHQSGTAKIMDRNRD